VRWWAALLAGLVGLSVASTARTETAKRSIVFVSPASEELDTSLRDALTAQLSGGEAEVVFEHFATTSTSLRNQVSEARSLASAHDAAGVFWLDAQVDGDWLVYLSEPSGDRVLVRRITVEPGGASAATEAVAVITRQSSEALLAGETIGMQPVDVPREPEITSPPTHLTPAKHPVFHEPMFTRPHGLAIAISYVGDSPARTIPWQSGARVSLSYRARSGFQAGAGFTLFKQAVIEAPGLVFQVARSPFDLGVGWAFGHGRLVPTLELRGLVELAQRHNVSVSPDFEPTPDSTRVALFLSPHFRIGYTVSAMLELFVGGGADLALNGFSYVTRVDGQDRELLKTHEIRPAVELGGIFWP